MTRDFDAAILGGCEGEGAHGGVGGGGGSCGYKRDPGCLHHWSRGWITRIADRVRNDKDIGLQPLSDGRKQLLKQ